MLESPKLLKMLKTFKNELVEYAKHGAPNVSELEYKNRLKTCMSCPELKDNYRCGICGCVVEQKAKWATTDCPDNKWKKTAWKKK